jgi:transposase
VLLNNPLLTDPSGLSVGEPGGLRALRAAPAAPLHARVPRVECSTHGVRTVRVPWAEARSRFTMLMERLVIDLIQQCSTVTGGCRIARIMWDEAWGVMHRAFGECRSHS